MLLHVVLYQFYSNLSKLYIIHLTNILKSSKRSQDGNRTGKNNIEVGQLIDIQTGVFPSNMFNNTHHIDKLDQPRNSVQEYKKNSKLMSKAICS